MVKDDASSSAIVTQRTKLGRNKSELRTSIVEPSAKQTKFERKSEFDMDAVVDENVKQEAIFFDKFHGKENMRLKMAKQAQLLKEK